MLSPEVSRRRPERHQEEWDTRLLGKRKAQRTVSLGNTFVHADSMSSPSLLGTRERTDRGAGWGKLGRGSRNVRVRFALVFSSRKMLREESWLLS